MVETVGVVADHRGGGLQQARAGAVGELQVDPSCGGEVALEAHYVRQLGAAPAVDRLVRVPDHEHVVMSLGELANEDVLREVRVLVLVDQHAREAVAGMRIPARSCGTACRSRSRAVLTGFFWISRPNYTPSSTTSDGTHVSG